MKNYYFILIALILLLTSCTTVDKEELYTEETIIPTKDTLNVNSDGNIQPEDYEQSAKPEVSNLTNENSHKSDFKEEVITIRESLDISKIDVPLYENYRIIDGFSYDDDIILIYLNNDNRSENKIICYDELHQTDELLTQDMLNFTGREKKHITDSLIVISGDKAEIFIDKETKSVLHIEYRNQDDSSFTSYDDNYDKSLIRTDEYIEVVLDDHNFIRYDNTDVFNYEFQWLENKAVAYYNEDNKLKIIDIINSKLLILDLDPFMPDGFVDYYGIEWLSSKEILFTALCEENVTLQVIDIAENEVIFEYSCGRDGYVIDIIGETIFVMNIDDNFSVSTINVIDYSTETIVLSDKPIQFVTVNKDTLNMYFDIYIHKNQYQTFNKIENIQIDKSVKNESDLTELYDNAAIVVEPLIKMSMTND